MEVWRGCGGHCATEVPHHWALLGSGKVKPGGGVHRAGWWQGNAEGAGAISTGYNPPIFWPGDVEEGMKALFQQPATEFTQSQITLEKLQASVPPLKQQGTIPYAQIEEHITRELKEAKNTMRK